MTQRNRRRFINTVSLATGGGLSGIVYSQTRRRAQACTIPLSMTKHIVHLFAAVLLASLMACGSGQPLQMTAIQLGRSVNSDHTVGGFTTTFTPDDSIYLAVLTGGAGSATIRVRWKYGQRVIDEPKKQVSYNQAAATDFRLQSPGGFPRGDYTAEVFINDQLVGTREFKVEMGR